MAVTIRDVANKAGVSISTVSAVINGTKYVSPKLRRAVEDAIDELGYIPSLLGRALSSKRSSMLAYVIPTVTNPFFSSMIQTVETNVFKQGFGLIICSSEEAREKAERYEAFLLGAHVDGVLLSPLSTRPVDEQCRPFLERGIPVVVLAGSRHFSETDCVILDDSRGMERVTQYLLQLGHRRIAFVGRQGSYSTEVRLAAVKATLEAAGVPLPEKYIALIPNRAKFMPPTEAYRQSKELLTRPDAPTAVVCHNDAVAVGVLQACYDLGLHVPNDVTVTGFDDTLALASSPQLTTLRVPVEEMAELATELLLARVTKDESEAETEPVVHAFEPELVVRASSGAPKERS